MHLLGGLEVTTVDHGAQHVDVERLALRERVHHQRDLRREIAQLAAEHVTEALRHRHVAVPHPHAGHSTDASGGDLVLEQLPREQSVAAGQFPEPPGAAGVDRATECAFDQAAGGRGRQRIEVEAAEQTVLPERGNRVGFPPGRTHRHHQAGVLDLRQLVDHVSRQPVEQMGVIDSDHHPAVTLLGHKGTDDPTNAGQRVGHGVAHGSGERAQRDGASRLGADDPGCAFS